MAAPLRTLYASFMVLSSAASICGNLLLLLVHFLNKELQSDTLGLKLSFSISDLVLGLATIPFGVHNALTSPAGYPSEDALCQVSGFILVLLQTSSIHSLTWTTIDKFTEICFALSYSSIWTTRRSWVVLALVWLFCLLNACLPLLGFGRYVYSEWRFLCCPEFSPDHRYFVFLWMVVGILIPILSMCSLYGYIVYVGRKQARRGTFMCNELHCFQVPANNYLKSSIVMVTTAVCLLLCWLPYVSVCLYETISGQQSPAVTSALSTWLVLTSAALNPWITCMTQTYRAAVRRTFSRFLQSGFGVSLESHHRSSVVALNTANRISTTTTTTDTCPPSSSPPL